MFKTILAISFLATTAAVCFLLLRPLYFTDIKALQEKRDSFNEALADSKEVQKKRDELLEKYNFISSENLERLNKVLPQDPGSMKFILEVDNIAQRNGVVLKNIDVEKGDTPPAEDSENKDVREVKFSLSVTAPYASFRSFLKEVEKNLRLTDVSSINLSAGEKDFYEFNLAGTFYWEPVK